MLFNTFVPRKGYVLDDAARELGQQCNTMIFTWEEMTNAADELPLELVADDSAYEYEKLHLPEGVWPPTASLADWASGLDLFDVEREESPIELRWFVYQKAYPWLMNSPACRAPAGSSRDPSWPAAIVLCLCPRWIVAR